MSLRPKYVIRLTGLVAVGLVVVWIVVSTRSVSPQVMEERRQIAKACLSMLRSTLTNEVDIAAADPRIPEVIRALRPVHIELAGTDAVVTRTGSPAEYHLSRSPNDAKTWILYGAGFGGVPDHRELLRIQSE